jgi:hypothetical protein
MTKRDTNEKKRRDSIGLNSSAIIHYATSEGEQSEKEPNTPTTSPKKKTHFKRDSLGLDLNSGAFIETRDKRSGSANAQFSPTRNNNSAGR